MDGCKLQMEKSAINYGELKKKLFMLYIQANIDVYIVKCRDP